MRISEIFERFFAVRKCAACGELLSYEYRNEAFCSECRLRWNVEKTKECPDCAKAVCECICMTKTLSRAGAICHHKAVTYSSSRAVPHRTLMFIKRNNNPRVTAFLATELVGVLKADKTLIELNGENCVITFVPRGKRATVKYGLDQSELLARAVSEKMGIPFVTALHRRFGGAEQKKLGAIERAKNVKALFEPSGNISELVGGKRVILIDDVVTTGASMAACISYLRGAGARETVCLSVATTEYQKK